MVGENISYVRLVTNGNGACALHAAFGECGLEELKCENARKRAAEGMRKLHMSGGGTALNKSVYTAIWSELAGPAARAREKGIKASPPKLNACGVICQSSYVIAQQLTYANGAHLKRRLMQQKNS